MFRKMSWLVGAALLTATAASAQVSTTVVMKSGDRQTGQQNLSFRWDKGHVGTWRVGDVAYVEFANMPNVDVNLTGSEEAVILRDGRIIKGQVLELGVQQNSGDYLVIIRDQGNQEHRFQAGQVARVYFAGGTAAATAAPTTGTAATTPAAGGGIVVPARQACTGTGIMVRNGEVVEFNTTGTIQLSGDSADTATAAGSKAARMAAANAPVPNVLAGALVARIGNGRAFPIGDQTSVQMPGAGQLFLCVNDDHPDDNAGEFRVEIRRTGRRR